MNNIIEEPFGRCIFCLRLTGSGALCLPCGDKLDISAAWCVGERRDVLMRALDAYKFEHAKAAATVLARLLDQTLPILDDTVVVTAVPTVSSHIRERGYDHTELIARQFAKLRSLPYSSLIERHDSYTQHFASRRERLAHARKAFKASGSPEQVLLIDDIVTTGATAQAAAKALRDAGGKHIHIAIIARQPLDGSSDL
jgi:ComF family protein